MRLTLHLLGVEVLDLAFNEPATFEAAEFEPYQDAGTTGSWPISFTRPAVPWEDPGSLHQFDPDDGGENP